jgi:hypothetical protein
LPTPSETDGTKEQKDGAGDAGRERENEHKQQAAEPRVQDPVEAVRRPADAEPADVAPSQEGSVSSGSGDSQPDGSKD